MPLLEEAHKAARLLLDQPYVRIVARNEPDAVCAAALLAHALRRESVDFHVSWAPRLDEPAARALADERPDCVLLVGLSGDAAVLETGARRAIVLDAAPPTLAGEAVVHDDASLAGLAHLVAAGISKRNLDLAPLALAGALASMRQVGGFPGLDGEILREALEEGVLLREPFLALHGANLAAALAQLDAPYVAGVTGRARNVRKLLADLRLPAEAPVASVAGEEARRLGDALVLRLLQQPAPDGALDVLLRPALRGLQGPHMGLEAGDLARVAEAACAAERPGLAFAALWPDAPSAGEALDSVASLREELVGALMRAERDARREGRVVVAEAPRPGLCAPLADRLAVSLVPREGVAVVHAPEREGAHVAIRSFAFDVGEAARAIAPPAWGTPRAARLWAPDATRVVKALAERAGGAA